MIWKEKFTCTNLQMRLLMMVINAISGQVKTDLPKLHDELQGKLRSLESLGCA